MPEFEGLGPSAMTQKLIAMLENARKNPLPPRTKAPGRPEGDKPKPKLVPNPQDKPKAKSSSSNPLDKTRAQAEQERIDWARNHPDNKGPQPGTYKPPVVKSSGGFGGTHMSDQDKANLDKPKPLPKTGGIVRVDSRKAPVPGSGSKEIPKPHDPEPRGQGYMSKPIPPVPGKSKLPLPKLPNVIRLTNA